MDKTMTEICDYLNNYFWEKKISGTFTIEDGQISVSGLKNGQYFRIKGSTFNDGVHLYPITETSRLDDETFRGEIWAMAVPKTVVALASEISEWQEKYGGANTDNMSPFNSESFSGYAYSKNGSSATGGATAGWQDLYANRLKPYRRLRGAS